MTLPAGTSIGKYVVRRKLAEGGMAEIYLCSSRGAQGFAKDVVIKRIRSFLANDPEFVKMFIAEARIACLLNHANVVQIFDFDQHEDTYYLAMEYVRGRSLWELGTRAKELMLPLPPTLVAHIGAEVARGLEHAHRLTEGGQTLGLVHRDVSPHNVLLSFDGAVKLTDFGIARAGTRHTAPGMIKGKFAYMAPEQARGDEVDARTDVFALGVVLWELLTGAPLFDGKTDVAVLRAVQEQALVPPSHVNPGVPPALDDALMRALQRDPALRFQSAHAFERELAQVVFRHAETLEDTNVGAFLRSVFGEPPSEEALGPPQTPAPLLPPSGSGASPRGVSGRGVSTRYDGPSQKQSGSRPQPRPPGPGTPLPTVMIPAVDAGATPPPRARREQSGPGRPAPPSALARGPAAGTPPPSAAPTELEMPALSGWEPPEHERTPAPRAARAAPARAASTPPPRWVWAAGGAAALAVGVLAVLVLSPSQPAPRPAPTASAPVAPPSASAGVAPEGRISLASLPVHVGALTVLGPLTAAEVEGALREQRGSLSECMRGGQAPPAGGPLTLQVLVGKGGGVDDAAVNARTLLAPALELCLRRTLVRWQFPSPADGGAVAVAFPWEPFVAPTEPAPEPAQAAVVPAAPAAPPPEPARVTTGKLVLTVAPWAMVSINGRPPQEVAGGRAFRLPPGKVRVKATHNGKVKEWEGVIRTGQTESAKLSFLGMP